MEWVQSQTEVHTKWTARSRCVPEWSAKARKLGDAMEKLNARAAGRIQKAYKVRCRGISETRKNTIMQDKVSWDPSEHVNEWHVAAKAHRGALAVRHVRDWREMLREMVITKD